MTLKPLWKITSGQQNLVKLTHLISKEKGKKEVLCKICILKSFLKSF